MCDMFGDNNVQQSSDHMIRIAMDNTMATLDPFTLVINTVYVKYTTATFKILGKKLMNSDEFLEWQPSFHTYVYILYQKFQTVINFPCSIIVVLSNILILA